MASRIVSLRASSTASAEALKPLLLEAAGVYKKEAGTIEWIAIQDVSDELEFVVFERFDSLEVRPSSLTLRLF